MNNIVIYEGDSYKNFYPFTINHATFEIRVGALTLLDLIKLNQSIENDTSIILIVRDSIKDIVADRYPEAIVNPNEIPDNSLKIQTSMYLQDNLFSFIGMKIIENEDKYLQSLFNKTDSLNISDKSCLVVGDNVIQISASARVRPGTILDSSNGMIIIDDNALVDIGCMIKGPAYIGKNSIINPGAKLKDVAIGPYCKIGGEVEHTTFHGYSNKQHDGYLGHSYVGEWVNLGANTNNSDLKNNYSSIKVDMGDEKIDVGMFAGCLIGDYTKTGISTMINTGTYIGIGCNLFGAGFQNKHIPNFSWGMDDDKTDFNKFIQTLEIVKRRRKQKVASSELELLKNIYKNKI